MTKVFLRICCILAFAFAGAMGGWTGQLIAQRGYPLTINERVNLSPGVKPGLAVQLAQYVTRHHQCDLVVKRTITTSTGQRIFIAQHFEEGFGPLGGDKYILPVPTPDTASLGPAKMYSKGYSWCSWVDHVIGPSESEAWWLDFDFTVQMQMIPTPRTFASIGVKQPETIKGRISPTESE